VSDLRGVVGGLAPGAHQPRREPCEKVAVREREREIEREG